MEMTLQLAELERCASLCVSLLRRARLGSNIHHRLVKHISPFVHIEEVVLSVLAEGMWCRQLFCTYQQGLGCLTQQSKGNLALIAAP